MNRLKPHTILCRRFVPNHLKKRQHLWLFYSERQPLKYRRVTLTEEDIHYNKNTKMYSYNLKLMSNLTQIQL